MVDVLSKSSNITRNTVQLLTTQAEFWAELGHVGGIFPPE